LRKSKFGTAAGREQNVQGEEQNSNFIEVVNIRNLGPRCITIQPKSVEAKKKPNQ